MDRAEREPGRTKRPRRPTLSHINTARFMLTVALVAASAVQAGARGDGSVHPGAERTGVPVRLMPPVMRAAYLNGIRDELIAHGYDPGRDRKTFDDGFATAIRRYQIDAGLRPDGIASKALLEHLLFAFPKVYADGSRGLRARAALPRSGRIDQAPAPRKLRQPDEEPVPSPAPRGRVAAKPLPDAPRSANPLRPHPGSGSVLRAPRSAAGGFVSRTQRSLRERGYYKGPVDGRFSDSLSAAIRAFQKNNRLPVTGVIDGPLLAALS